MLLVLWTLITCTIYIDWWNLLKSLHKRRDRSLNFIVIHDSAFKFVNPRVNY